MTAAASTIGSGWGCVRGSYERRTGDGVGRAPFGGSLLGDVACVVSRRTGVAKAADTDAVAASSSVASWREPP